MQVQFPLPETCKAGVVTNHGPAFELKIEDVQVPHPGPDQILIKLNVTGLCYSDIHYMLEDLPLPRMGHFSVSSPGHEGAGVVVAIGKDVKGWALGDRAGVTPTWDTCMSCELCATDMECHCAQAIPTGLKVSGTYQQYITSPARYTSRIPDSVDDCAAGPIMCSGSTMFRAIRESNLRAGNWAVFIGAGGGVGHMGIQIARAMGMRVIGIDAGPEKEKICLDLGCEAFIDFTKSANLSGEVRKIAEGKGAHGVFVTASSSAGYKVAPRMVRVGGVVVCVGMPPSGTVVAGDDPMYLILNNIKVVGSLTGSRQDTANALSMAARGLLKPIYELYDIEELPGAVQRLVQGKVNGRCVVQF
ncbi:unnamed protein product [Penicillium salamii]|uniref:Enoyl reductase (ER) domain-containing protein n=1 Tax=Penicillium salamii TaxID=1612424 RepID=A0A9W4J3R5_9EURO|nr:unnamed protein product [Penicillium salamii]CAG8083955.1 unnamed protein product [Penicillium salamii]CAG8240012.1 unnamed protein product [Penicillium salamii]CAG8243148.1 unnamed protein product [Penicillium salamii]CAG8264592.1 unnamed protein product [Penicillium salamii]